MKKAFLLILASFFLVTSFAQVTFGPRVGFTLSKYGYLYSDAEEYLEPEVNFKTGPAIGGMMNVQITDFLAFQPSLMFAKKGTGVDVADLYSGEAVVDGFYRVKVAYLEVPLNLALGLKLGTFRMQIFAGPYFAYAIAGQHKWDFEENVAGIRTDITGDEKMIFKNEVPADAGSNEVYYQRPLDIGLNFGVGYKVDRVLLNLGFAMGLANLQPELADEGSFAADHKYANRSIFLSAAWLFGKD